MTVQFRYDLADVAHFQFRGQAFEELSNFGYPAPGEINDLVCSSSEALYQLARYPGLPERQREIAAAKTPKHAKTLARRNCVEDSRDDWMDRRMRIMAWALSVKIARNWEVYAACISLGRRPAPSWRSVRGTATGARATQRDGTLVGENRLGRLWSTLWRAMEDERLAPGTVVRPPAIPNFLINGRPVEPIEVDVAPDLLTSLRTRELNSPGENLGC